MASIQALATSVVTLQDQASIRGSVQNDTRPSQDHNHHQKILVPTLMIKTPKYYNSTHSMRTPSWDAVKLSHNEPHRSVHRLLPGYICTDLPEGMNHLAHMA